ncbi:MAG: hypothetical protein RIG62_08955 [Cyclobacteriaceae bacterium]
MNHFETLKRLYWYANGYTAYLDCKPEDVQQLLWWMQYDQSEKAQFYIQLLDNVYATKLTFLVDRKFSCFPNQNEKQQYG